MKDLKYEPCEELGGCPECGHTGQHLTVQRDHWYICDDHKTKWWVGSDLFSRYGEDEAIWKKNSEKLAGYIDVRPRHFQTAFEQRRKTQLAGAAFTGRLTPNFVKP